MFRDYLLFITFVVALIILDYINKRQKSIPKERESDYIITWSHNRHSDAIRVINQQLPVDYQVTNEESHLFYNIFDCFLEEKKKNHFESKATVLKEGVFKDENLWLIVALGDYCYLKCIPFNGPTVDTPMLEYTGDFSEYNKELDKVFYYNKYKYTAAGIVAKKAILASALRTENENSAVRTAEAIKRDINRGWIAFSKIN